MAATIKDVLLSDAVIRVRDRILETAPLQEFWQNNPDVYTYLDEGQRRQHEVVIDNARKAGLIRDASNDYLAWFTAEVTGTIAQYNGDIPIPADSIQIKNVLLLSSPPFDAEWRNPELDRTIRSYKIHQPVPYEAFFTVLSRGGGTAGKIRTYHYGPNALPQMAIPYAIEYIRAIPLIVENSPLPTYLGTPDPWANGPIMYAAGRLLNDQREARGESFISAAGSFANGIIPPPQQAQQ